MTMEKKPMFDINLFEKEINDNLIEIIKYYQPSFNAKEVEIKYNGISRFGSIKNENYQSEVEVLFMTMNKVDYVNVFDCLIILNNMPNITIEDFKENVKREFEAILHNPNKDVVEPKPS